MLSAQDLILENLDEDTKQVPEERLKDAATGRSLYLAMRDADKGSIGARARHQAMLDGEPPFDQAILQATGQGSKTNINWGDAENIMSGVMSGMIDLSVSTEKLVRVPLLKSKVPDDEDRQHNELVLSDEISKTIRRWEDFDYNYQNLALHTLGHGVGVAYFEDSMDWRFQTTGLGHFVLPRGTRASEKWVEIAGICHPYKLHELYAKIRHEEAATKRGWNVEAVKSLMVKRVRGDNSSESTWEELTLRFRNNDIGTGGSSEVVNIIHLWVQEFDGTVSLYMASEGAVDGEGKDDPWLFKKRGVYEEVRRAFTIFTSGIGTNGTYHSISGILRKIYPQVQAINRAQSNMLDAAVMQAGVMLQPKNELALGRMQFAHYGPMTLLPAAEHASVVTHTPPNLATGIAPILSDLRETINRRAGQFQGDSGFGGQNVEKTRFQVAAELESLGKVGATQVNLWYPPWGRLMKEVVRRMCRDGYSDKMPGGREVAELKRRLKERGVDPDALFKCIDFEAVTAERAIGAGSGAARTATLTQLQELAGEYDEVGRYNLTRDRTAAALGGNYDLAERYAPRSPNERPPQDAQIALLENAVMKGGNEIPVVVNQRHVTHLDTHLPVIAEYIQALEEGQMDLVEAVGPLTIIHTHCVEHLEHIQQDPTIQERTAMYRQALQQAGEQIWNGHKKLEAMQRKAQEEGAAEGEGQQGGGLPPEMQRDLWMAQQKLAIIAEEAELKQQIKAQEHAQKMQMENERFQQQAAHADARVAGEILSNARKQAAAAMNKPKR